MRLASLLEQTDEARRECVNAASLDERRELFAEIWGGIRQKSLYGGQPSSENSNQGVQLARLALSMAMDAADSELQLEAWCMLAYTLNANEQYAESLEYYRHAIEGLERTGNHARAARNRLGYLTALSMVGRYDEAIGVGWIAQQWFQSNADDEGLARLCVNMGTMYQRLDQHALGLEYHEKAIQYFTKTNNEQALGQAYLNAGNALGCIDRFEEADLAYGFSEQIGERLGLSNLVTQARYNRAYLYFLRGRNMQAVEHFGKLRVFFKENASHRHAALCDLDETEIYLQLNLPNDAARLARSAMESFANLNMSYEFAKASVFLGIALTQNRQFGDALQVFRRGQTLFEQENNQYWVALVKLYRAEVLYAVGRLWEARALAAAAHDAFAGMGIVSKRVVSMILLGRVALDLNQNGPGTMPTPCCFSRPTRSARTPPSATAASTRPGGSTNWQLVKSRTGKPISVTTNCESRSSPKNRRSTKNCCISQSRTTPHSRIWPMLTCGASVQNPRQWRILLRITFRRSEVTATKHSFHASAGSATS
jgi:tetratricopeptide (TPR) repeat protein